MLTDNEPSTLREPFLPPGDDHVADEEHPQQQRRCQSTQSGFGEEGEFDTCDGGGNGGSQSNGEDDSRWSTASQDPNSSYPLDVVATAEQNVRRSLAIVVGDFATKSIWNQNLLSIFVVLVWKNRPEYVGFVQATLGIFQTTSSVAATWWISTRRYSYNTNTNRGRTLPLLLNLASLAGLCLTVVSLGVVVVQDPRITTSFFPSGEGSRFLWFLLANGLWGVFWGVTDSALSTVLVESASVAAPFTTTTTTTTTTLQHTIQEWRRRVELGGAFGTLLALVFFFKLGNEWTLRNCLVVMTCGVACNLFGVTLLCFLRPISFDDDDDDDWDGSSNQQGYEPLLPQDEERIDETYAAAGNSSSSMEDDEGSNESTTTDEAEPFGRTRTRTRTCADQVLVPLLIHLSDAFSSLAGGISSWYFPLLLVQLLKLRPVSVQCLCLIIPMGQRLSPLLANRLASVIGPCLACISMQWTYVAVLLSMTASVSRACITTTNSNNWGWTICVLLYVVHGSLMNSTSFLSQSLIAQYVPLEEQYRWNKAETFQKLLWSCSGILGGCLVDSGSEWGMVANFHATAILQFLACLPLAVLYCLKNPRLENADEGDAHESLSFRGEEVGGDDVDGNDESNNEINPQESTPQESTPNYCCEQTTTATKGPSISDDSGNQGASTPSTEATESVESDGDSSSDSTNSTIWFDA
jgi:hypothetical protein